MKSVAKILSRYLAKQPKLMFGIQQLWLKIGHRMLDLKMASWVVRRPEWLRSRSLDQINLLELPLSVDNKDSLEIARRIINSHSNNSLHTRIQITKDSIWGQLLDSHYRRLVQLISGGESQKLAEFLSVLFRTEAVNGFTYGSTFSEWPHRWHYLAVQIELSVVQLAEAVGLIRAECHEQGEVAFWRKLVSEEQLIEKLENFFEFRIEQPRIGDPRGIMFGGRFLTRETCSHLHSAFKMSEAIERDKIGAPLNIVEIGGGFGGTSYWLRKILGDRIHRQAIIDLPEVGFVQAYFLGMCFPDHLVLKGENSTKSDSPIMLVPYDELALIDFRPNIVINQDSMPEMPHSEVVRYLEWITENLDGLFISFNQEALAAGGTELQVWVPSLISKYSRLQRISRQTSWDRRGYVEEIYKTL